MKLLLGSILSIILIGSLGSVYAYERGENTETFTFYIKEESDRVEISGNIYPTTDIFVTIWDHGGNMIIDTESKIVEKETGYFEYRFDKSHLSGYGQYTGEISDGIFTQGFEFSLTSVSVPPLKQVDKVGDIHEIQCKPNLTLIFKADSWDPACVKHSSVDKLIERGWASDHDPHHKMH